MQARDVLEEIDRQVAWHRRNGRTPAAIDLGTQQYAVLQQAMDSPSCESPAGYVEPSELQVLGLPVRRTDSPFDVNVLSA